MTGMTTRTFASDMSALRAHTLLLLNRWLDHPYSVERFCAASSMMLIVMLLPSAAAALNLLLVLALVDLIGITCAYIGAGNRPYGVAPRFIFGQTLREHATSVLVMIALIALVSALVH